MDNENDPHLQLAEEAYREKGNMALNLVADLWPHRHKFNGKSREFLKSLHTRWEGVEPGNVFVSPAQLKWLLDLADQAKIDTDGTGREP